MQRDHVEVPVNRRPAYVDPQKVGPLVYPVDRQSWQQPIWGDAVRLYRGTQARFDRTKTAGLLLKPGQRETADGWTIVEPRGGADGSWEGLLDFLRACWRAGWLPHQVEHALRAKAERGPGAYHRWKDVSAHSEWFLELWHEIASTDTRRRANTTHDGRTKTSTNSHTRTTQSKRNRTSPGGPIPFAISEDVLARLRCWLVDHPGRTQTQLKVQAHAEGVLDAKGVVPYLHELEARGLATWTPRPTTGGGRPAKVWAAVLTNDEVAAAALEHEVRVCEALERAQRDLEFAQLDHQLNDLFGVGNHD